MEEGGNEAEDQEGWVEEDEEIDEVELAINEVLEDFIPKILSHAIDGLNNDRDEAVLQELRDSLKATEVDVIKEALYEAEVHNLTKAQEVIDSREWLADIQREIELFDKIREQRHITTELDGSTHLLRLLGKAYDLNIPISKKKGTSKKHGSLLNNGVVDIENSNLALRMGAQTATTHFDLDTYEIDDEEENQMDMAVRETEEIKPWSPDVIEDDESDEEDSEEEEEDSEMNPEELFWDTLDDTDDEDETNTQQGSVSIQGSVEAEQSTAPKPPKIDVLGMWRMRVPRHRKLLKDCVIHLGKCTRRLDATADKTEVRELFKRLRHVCTVGDRRAMVELIVMTEIMHLYLDEPSEGNHRTALHYAAAHGRLMALKRLVKCGARVHAMDFDGNTPLHLAAAANQGAICQLLMYNGAGTARQRRDGSNCLHVAALAGATEACEAMISLGAKAEKIKTEPKQKGAIVVDSDAPTCVGIDVRRGMEGNTNENSALLCAAMGVIGTATGVMGWPHAMMDVSLSSGKIFHTDTVRLLLEWGADVNLAGERGVTLLHLVVSNKELFPVFREIVEEHNFALGIKETTSIVPLSLQAAAEAEHDDGVTEHAVKEKKRTLTKKGSSKKSAKVEPSPSDGKEGKGSGGGGGGNKKSKSLDKFKSASQAVMVSNAFEDAEEKHKEALHRMRWRRTLNVNARNGDGNTALNVAIYNRNRDAAMVLLLGFHCQCDLNSYLNDLRRVKNPLEEPPPCVCLSSPLNVNIANDYGFTALHIAARQHDLDLIKHLLKRGANKNRLAMMSGGPLHLAVTVGGAVDIVKMFVREGADIHLRNNQHGRTPLHILCTDTARPWDGSKGCLRPLQPLLLALLDCSDHAQDKDRMGRTPLALAVLSQRLSTVQLLLDHRRKEGSPDSITGIHVKVGGRTSDVSIPDKVGFTVLHHAAMLGNVALLEMLLNGNDAIVIDNAAAIRNAAIAKKVGENKASSKKKKKSKKTSKVSDTPKVNGGVNVGDGKAATAVAVESSKKAEGSTAEEASTSTAVATSAVVPSTAENIETDEKKAEDLRERDKLNESIISRGCLYAQDKEGRSVFHIAAELPATKPEVAHEIMSKLMERITCQPCGIGVWNNSIDDTEDLNVIEPEDGYEEWPATYENGFTAWHVIVSHVMSSKDAIQNAGNESAPATNEPASTVASTGSSSLEEGKAKEGDKTGGQSVAAGTSVATVNPTPPPVKVPVTDVALRVLRIMLNARTYAPDGKKAKRRKLDAIDIDGETCLMTCLRLGNVTFARTLLEFSDFHDFGLNARSNKYGRTALIMAVDMALFDISQKLIALGSRVNESDRKGNTPLMAACRIGVGGRLDGLSFQARKRLEEEISGGTDVGDEMEMDPEEEAVKAALVDLILNSEADPNRANEEGDTALHFICEQASSPVQSLMVTRLLQASANPSKVNKRKDSPLHLAIENLDDSSSKSKTIVLALLEAKADYRLKNRKRRTPHELAVYLKKYTLAGLVAKYDEFAVKIESKKKKKR